MNDFIFIFLGILLFVYFNRGIFKSTKSKQQDLHNTLDLLSKVHAKKIVDSQYNLCLHRDRSISFDEWVNIAIQSMAVDEIESGETDQEIVDDLKKSFGEANWEVFYPAAKVVKELSAEESYWTALRKFDEQVAKDLLKQ